MKTVKDLKVGDICYWFSIDGEFQGEVKVETIKIVDNVFYHIKIEHQGTLSTMENDTYGGSIDFPSMLCFFTKEAAVKYFIKKIKKITSNFKNSIENLYNN